MEAKELTNRLGVGVKKNTSFDLPELAAVYYPSATIAGGGRIGELIRKKDYSKFSFNAGVRRIIFKEENMNFYMGGSVGLVNF